MLWLTNYKSFPSHLNPVKLVKPSSSHAHGGGTADGFVAVFHIQLIEVCGLVTTFIFKIWPLILVLWQLISFSLKILFDPLKTVWSNYILVSRKWSLIWVGYWKTMTWETFKLILFSVGLLLSLYEIYERRKDGKKVPYTSIALVVLFVVLILGKFLWFLYLDRWCHKWCHPYTSSNH